MKYLSRYKIFEANIKTIVPGVKDLFDSIFKGGYDDTKNWLKTGGKPDQIKGNIKKVVTETLNTLISNVEKIITKESDIQSIYDDYITQLSNYKANLLTAIKQNFGTEPSDSASKISTKVIDDIINHLQDAKFKKENYDNILNLASKDQIEDNIFKFQKSKLNDILRSIQENLTKFIDAMDDKELEKITNSTSKITPEIVKQYVKDKVAVKYKLDGYDETKNDEEQKDKVGIGIITKFDEPLGIVTIKGEESTPIEVEIHRLIAAESGTKETNVKLKDELNKIKDDNIKMSYVSNFVDYINKYQNDKAKIGAIDRILSQK